MELTYPIEILRAESKKLNKEFKKLKQEGVEPQYHLLKGIQVFNAIELLQKEHIKNHDTSH